MNRVELKKQLINRKSLFTEWALLGAILYGRAKSFTFGGAYNRLSTRGNSLSEADMFMHPKEKNLKNTCLYFFLL